jgi:Flp pilus assembly protein TadD
LRQDDLGSAIKDFRFARELNPRYAKSWLFEAQTLDKLGDFEGATSAINEYLKLRPQSEEAQVLKERLSKE